MSPRASVAHADGCAAVDSWLREREDTARATLATAVRFTLQQLAHAAPGGAVEVRVPPFAAVQCVPGMSHTRGTPPAVVEADPHVWLALATGEQSWHEAVRGRGVSASGERSDLSGYLPLPECSEAFKRARYSDLL